MEAISKIGRQIEILERPFNIPSYVYMNVGGGKTIENYSCYEENLLS